MGDPLSAVMCGFFMEDLEKKAITSAPEECRPRLWKRCVDDIVEKVKAGHTQKLADHLNTIDDSGNIKFLHTRGGNGKIHSFSGHKNSPHKQAGHKNKNPQETHAHSAIFIMDIRTPRNTQIISCQDTVWTHCNINEPRRQGTGGTTHTGRTEEMPISKMSTRKRHTAGRKERKHAGRRKETHKQDREQRSRNTAVCQRSRWRTGQTTRNKYIINATSSIYLIKPTSGRQEGVLTHEKKKNIKRNVRRRWKKDRQDQ